MATIRGEHVTVIWAGVDAGKGHHHCVVIDDSGRHLLSRRVANDEEELLRLLADTLALGEDVTWGIDLADGGAALLIDLLLSHGQHVLHIPGMAVNRASEGYRGEGKPTPRTRRSSLIRPGCAETFKFCGLATKLVAELKILTRHRRDLADDRTRVVNRLRGHLTGIFPGLLVQLRGGAPLSEHPKAFRPGQFRVRRTGCPPPARKLSQHRCR
ncbi:IS110 family transposase [Streptomyces sp. NPDC054888]